MKKMVTLVSIIPDVDVLLALAPEELAESVLHLANARKQHESIHLQAIASEINGQPGGAGGYPQNRKKEAELALSYCMAELLKHMQRVWPFPKAYCIQKLRMKCGWMLLEVIYRQPFSKRSKQ